MLEKVTITGADESINPEELIALSKEFPFIEWGILMSRKRYGTPRYPSSEWLAKLYCADPFVTGFRLSAHLCGAISRETASGNDSIISVLTHYFQRVQLNGCGEFGDPLMDITRNYTNLEFIIQVGTNELVEEILSGLAIRSSRFLPGRLSALVDCSGGTGLEIKSFPKTPGLHLGYAGGISPDNVDGILSILKDYTEPYWIDMESGVRTDDKFDLCKVRKVLEICRDFLIVHGPCDLAI